MKTDLHNRIRNKFGPTITMAHNHNNSSDSFGTGYNGSPLRPVSIWTHRRRLLCFETGLTAMYNGSCPRPVVPLFVLFVVILWLLWLIKKCPKYWSQIDIGMRCLCKSLRILKQFLRSCFKIPAGSAGVSPAPVFSPISRLQIHLGSAYLPDSR